MNIKIINFQQDSYNPNLKNQQKFLKIKNKQRPTNPTTQRNTHKDRQRGELRRGRERERQKNRERERETRNNKTPQIHQPKQSRSKIDIKLHRDTYNIDE